MQRGYCPRAARKPSLNRSAKGARSAGAMVSSWIIFSMRLRQYWSLGPWQSWRRALAKSFSRVKVWPKSSRYEEYFGSFINAWTSSAQVRFRESEIAGWYFAGMTSRS